MNEPESRSGERRQRLPRGERPADATGDGGLAAIHVRLGARLRAYFFAGILFTAPIAITAYLAWLAIDFVDSRVTPMIPAKYNPETYLPFALPGLGLLVLAVLLTLIGALMAGYAGRLVMHGYEGLLNRMPVVRGVYAAVKQIVEAVLAQKSKAFRQAVLVEYPRPGVWAIAFVTGRATGEIRNAAAEEMVALFVPTTPNPTSGFLLFVPKRQVIPLAMQVEDAFKLVVSGGIVLPRERGAAVGSEKPKKAAAVADDLPTGGPG
jgi:uncharacterized membrane protein